MNNKLIISLLALTPAVRSPGRGGGRGHAAGRRILLPDRVWDAVDNAPHGGWSARPRRPIEAVGPRARGAAPADATTITLPGTTLLPAIGATAPVLHPYNETRRNDQVLRVFALSRGACTNPPAPG